MDAGDESDEIPGHGALTTDSRATRPIGVTGRFFRVGCARELRVLPLAADSVPTGPQARAALWRTGQRGLLTGHRRARQHVAPGAGVVPRGGDA